jgi:hypothetical protein
MGCITRRWPRDAVDPQRVHCSGLRIRQSQVAAEHEDGPPSVVAEIYAALGDKDRAFDALERMAVVEPQRLPIMLMYPEMAVLRGDPRLTALRKRFGLPAH